MGTSKALLEWHGTTLLRRVVGVLLRTADPVVVVHAPGQELPVLPAAVERAVDAAPGRGPLEGIAAGLRAVAGRADVAFVSSTDVPLLHPAFVARVVASLGDADVAVPEVDGRLHPLAGAYRVSLLPAVEELLAADRLRPAFLYDAVATRRLSRDELLADPRVRAGDPELDSLRNLNTPEDDRAAAAAAPPAIEIEWFGTFRSLRGTARETLAAATLGAALDQLPELDGATRHSLVAVNGETFSRERDAPLVRGDRLAIVSAEAGG
jgi:molybdopterin-guanine dinucleotide biosynthesis protein A